MEKYIPCKWEAKEARVAILISDKIDLKIKTITRDKKGHYVIDQGINPRGRHNNCKCLCSLVAQLVKNVPAVQ